jgi:DNA polymerase alpha-associated DNA helicase A
MENTLRHVAKTMLSFVLPPDPSADAPRQPWNAPLLKVLFGLQMPSIAPLESLITEGGEVEEGSPIRWFDGTLNDSQKRAVEFTLRSKEVACIHGPPGVSSVSEVSEARADGE